MADDTGSHKPEASPGGRGSADVFADPASVWDGLGDGEPYRNRPNETAEECDFCFKPATKRESASHPAASKTISWPVCDACAGSGWPRRTTVKPVVKLTQDELAFCDELDIADGREAAGDEVVE